MVSYQPFSSGGKGYGVNISVKRLTPSTLFMLEEHTFFTLITLKYCRNELNSSAGQRRIRQPYAME